MATLNMSDITPPAAIPTGAAVTFFVATGSAAEGRPGEAGGSSDGARQMMGTWMPIATRGRALGLNQQDQTALREVQCGRSWQPQGRGETREALPREERRASLLSARQRTSPGVRSRGRLRSARGYTFVEILIAAAILAVALLAIANMFPTGYTNVTEAGRRTMSLTAAKQILEDTRSLPFDNVTALNGFDSTNPATLPAANPERDMARRWKYTLAGAGGGFAFNAQEQAEWATLSTAVPFNGSAQVSVVAVCPTAPCPPNPVSGTLQLVTVTISFQAKAGSFQLATLITMLM